MMRATLTDASTMTVGSRPCWIAAIVNASGRFGGNLGDVNEFQSDTEAVAWLQLTAEQRGESLDLVRRKVGDK